MFQPAAGERCETLLQAINQTGNGKNKYHT